MHMRNNIRVVVEHGSMTQATGRVFLTGIRRLHRSTTGGLPVKWLSREKLTVAGLIKVDRASNRKQLGPANKPSSRKQVGLVDRASNRKQPGPANKHSSRKQAGPVDKPSNKKQEGSGNNLKRMPFRALGVENKPKTTVIVAARAGAAATAVAGLVAEDPEDPAVAGLAVEDPAVVGLVTEDLVVGEAVVVEVLDS